jgi:hypothetical protein
LPALETQATTHLRQRFLGSWRKLDDPAADFVDEVSRRLDLGYIVVDRTKLSSSFEPWAHELIQEQEMSLFSEFRSCEGILVWENSD